MHAVIWENMYSKTYAEEKMEVEASNETEQPQHSASYSEVGSDLNKAEPFENVRPTPPTVKIRPSQQTICKFFFLLSFTFAVYL